MRRLLLLLFIASAIALPKYAATQVRVSGTVYDASRAYTLPAVSVVSTSGHGTVTDSLGRYTIVVKESDSISFSFLNRPTAKFPVRGIPNIFQFDISLHVPASELPAVKVRPRNYRMDSMQNRIDYARIFDYKKPGVDITTSPSGMVGLDLAQFINMFRFRQNRRMLAFQKRLLQEEADKFIDQRFNRAITRRITGLTGDSLLQFMQFYRPSYEFTQVSSDYEFLEYIKLAATEYRMTGTRRKEEGF